MLGEVPGYKDEQLVKSIEIGDLSMGTYKITITDIYNSEVFQKAYSSPKCRFTTAWLTGDGRLFDIDITIISPQAKETERNLTLRNSQAERVRQAIADIVMFLKKELR